MLRERFKIAFCDKNATISLRNNKVYNFFNFGLSAHEPIKTISKGATGIK